jgi:two-component system phosphate regulon sensor histidine kinase PhoR
MKKKTRYLLIISVVALLTVVLLQSAWLVNYFSINKERFNNGANNAMAEAAEQEYKYRLDQTQAGIEKRLLDTAKIMMRSEWLPVPKRWRYIISDKADPNSVEWLSMERLNGAIVTQLDSIYRRAASLFAYGYRKDNLERGTIFFRPFSVGMFADSMLKNYYFDSSAFRDFFKNALSQKGLNSDFRLVVNNPITANDSWFNKISTKPITINTNSSRLIAVRAEFELPYIFLVKKMIFILLGSIALICILIYCFYTILNNLFVEKKLSLIKNDFISNITHEFKTPIATVSAAIEALDELGAYDNPKRRTKYFNSARQELNRLSEMVNKLLNISIYEKKDIEIHKTQVNLSELISEIINNYEMIHSKEIKWEVISQKDVFIFADKDLIHIAVSNVIDNSIKYSTGIVHIIIQIKETPTATDLAITDHGIGMKPEDTQFVFDKFYRVNTGHHTKIKGYGLGLSYTKSILDAHKAHATIQSEPGKGTTFTLTFPRS